jgi:transcriptional regulator GlxA family with amidase domain
MAINTNRDLLERGKHSVAAARLAAVSNYIQTNFTDPALTVASVARRHKISPRYLQQLLEESGVSFVARVNELRLKRALTLLTKFPNRPIADISVQAGFSSVSHFNRLFRQRFGDTPGRMRDSS